MNYHEAEEYVTDVKIYLASTGQEDQHALDAVCNETEEGKAALTVYDAANAVDIGPIKVVNCTPHSIRFQGLNGDLVEVAPSGIALAATPVEKFVGEIENVSFVKTAFKPSEDGIKDIKALRRRYRNANVQIIGSIISAQAYPGEVVSMIPCEGFERVPPAEKRMRADKFNMFSKNVSKREFLRQLREDLAMGTVPFGTVAAIDRYLDEG